MFLDPTEEVGDFIWWMVFSWIPKGSRVWHQNNAMKGCLVKWYVFELGL
jgi:hypothetical protein